MVTAHDVDGRRERLSDVPVHVERRGENAGSRNQFAHLSNDLALGVIEIRCLQRTVKREENRIQRQVRLDRRQQAFQKGFHDLRLSGASALRAEGGPEHDLRPVRGRLEDLDHPSDRAFDALQRIANLIGLQNPTASPPVCKSRKKQIERIALLPDFGDQNFHNAKPSCSPLCPLRLSKMLSKAGWISR